MSDKRQRARVQGSWAKPLHKPQQPTSVSGSWNYGPRSFEFHQPADPIREIPAEKVIENAADFEISQGPTGVSRLRLIPGFLQQEEADWMFSKLLTALPWSQKTNYRMMGDAYEEPRLTCWYGELPYTYSRSTVQANAQWHPVLTTLRLAVEEKSGHTFNSLLCNLYRDGKDSIGWHSDSEPSLGPQPVIQPLPEDKGDYTYVERIRIPLTHGTLLLMEGCTQTDWQHQVAKEYHDRGPRINLTFRTIYPDYGPQRLFF
uniref:Alpha-ketoglutarate-dependent dioxygenase alkB homolog 3 n=1 Tax=Sinocyclocheilus rhinocerous TaxID=307959 RepID=A0A673GBA6_9TELE